MRSFLFLCLLVLALVSAAPQKPSKALLQHHVDKPLIPSSKAVPAEYEDKILQFLERIRNGMEEPNEELGLPALDPLTIQHLEYSLDNELVQVSVTFDNFIMTELRKFIVHSVEFTTDPIYFAIAATLPDLKIRSNYIIEGDIGIGSGSDDGYFEVEFKDYYFSAKFEIDLVHHDHLNINNLDYNYRYGEIHANFKSNQQEGSLGNIIGDFLNNGGSDELNQQEPTIGPLIAEEIIKNANPILNTKTLDDILRLIGV